VEKALTDFDAYLLGRTPEDQREKLEEQLFSDDQLFEEVLAAEDDLILRYFKGELSRQDRRQFEQEYLRASAQRARVEFMRDLLLVNGQVRDYASKPSWSLVRGQRWPFLALQSGLVALALIAVTVAVWLGSDVARLRAAVERAEKSGDALTREVAQLRSERNDWQQQQTFPHTGAVSKPGPELSLVLTPGVTRGGSGTRLLIPAGVESVRIHLSAPEHESYSTYRITIRTPEGTQAWGAGMKTLQAIVVPATLLSPGDYVLTVEGGHTPGNFETIEDYAFRVVR
jgi:hypothetical protein